MNTIQSIAKLEDIIALLAGYPAEDYMEIEVATANGLEKARVSLLLKGRED